MTHSELAASPTMRAARLWHAAVAMLLAAALVTQLVLTATGTGTNDPDAETLTRIVRFLSYFTVLSNILLCAVSVTLAVRPNRMDGALWRVLRLDSVVCMSVTGLVFVTALRGLEPLDGLRVLTDAVFHYAAPILAVVGWLLFGPRPRITGRVVAFAVVPPIVWAAYTLIRGAIVHFYPYPFIDVTEHGYARVFGNIFAVSALFVALGLGLWYLDTRLPRTDTS